MPNRNCFYMEHSKNRQLAINMIASYLSMGVSLGITFFLTPYIVESLGREAYGFIALTSNLIGYTSLVTIALNAMAGRFIMLKYVQGDKKGANEYFSSVFFSNIILGTIILLALIITVIYLEYFLDIPQNLIFDVKFLFAFMSLSSVTGLITGTWGIATFIKNRLELSNTRGIIGTLLNATIVICLFSIFPPHIWYMGISGLVGTIYVATTNWAFLRKLTPDLKISLSYFNQTKIWELITSGMWNVLTKLASILGHELDLLFANVFIGALAMGTFSITKNIPFLVLTINAAASGIFAPVLTQLYAEKKKTDLVNELNKSIRILGFISCITITGVFVLGKEFYSLWLPSQDAILLQNLTIVGMAALPTTLPNEALWNIFTITNKLKGTSIFTFCDNLAVFVIVFLAMYIVESPMSRLFILAGTRAALGNIRGMIFLPIYGAHCLKVKKTTFYPQIFKSLLCISVCCLICFLLKQTISIESWFNFIVAAFIVILVCIFVCYVIVLKDTDKVFIKEHLLRRIKKA